MSALPPDTAIQAGLRHHAGIIAAGVAGASTLALLAAGSLAPLLVGGITAAAVAAWLGNLGSNALANWLDQWARANLARAIGDDLDTEQRLMEALARDLQAQLAADDALATDVATLLEYTQAIPTALDALHGQGAQQIRLLRRLLEDLQSTTFRNERLHAVTLRAVEPQGAALRDRTTQSEAQLRADIEAVLAEVKKLQAEEYHVPKVSIGGATIGGTVGTYQNLTITGGTVSGPIIGSQTNYYDRQPPTSSVPPTAISQEDIDEQQELLDTHRRTLAVYLRRLAKLSDAHAPPEVSHGIHEARAGIRHVKATLRGWGVVIADHPDDAAEP